jgi:hypothetical protein
MSVVKSVLVLQMQRFPNYTPALKSALVKGKLIDVQLGYDEYLCLNKDELEKK